MHEDDIPARSLDGVIMCIGTCSDRTRRISMIATEAIRERTIEYLSRNGAMRIALFGSYVNGEAGPESDLDILAEFSDRKSLMQLARLERELSELVGIKVDLLTESSISPHLIDGIKGQMEVIYG
jgi:predicted nucleotidyltransferase